MVIRCGRLDLEVHTLAERPGTPLLLLHGLFGSSADWGDIASTWPGPVRGLDFAGHGGSAWTKGGAYYPELFVADADAVLGRLGSAYVAGAGLGAYVALLLAGARPNAVPAALLLPGNGLDGGGAAPNWARGSEYLLQASSTEPATGYDPMVRTLGGDPRPPDYARAYADAASNLLLVEDGSARPPWWEAVSQSSKARIINGNSSEALTLLADLPGASQPASAA